MAGASPNPRLLLFNRYQMPDDGGNCGPLRRLSTKRGGRGGRGRCRVISKPLNRASGQELFHNKLKKWIKRKDDLIDDVTYRSERVFNNDELHFNGFLRNLEDFVDFMLNVILSLVIFPGRWNAIMKELYGLSRIGHRPNYVRICMDKINRQFASDDEKTDFFNVGNLINPKSMHLEACSQLDNHRIKIRSDRGRHACIIAYRPETDRPTGFEQYADYLRDELVEKNPADIFFNKSNFELVEIEVEEVFGAMDRWPLDDSDSDSSAGGGGGGGTAEDSSDDDDDKVAKLPRTPKKRPAKKRSGTVGMRYSTRNRKSRTRSQTKRARRISGGRGGAVKSVRGRR